MQRSRLPRILFVVLTLAAAIHLSTVYPRLPDVVASHFDAQGQANGWQSKPVLLGFLIGGVVIAAVVGFGVPRIIQSLPAGLINLPNKEYWLSPEQRPATLAFLGAHFAWMGLALMIVELFAIEFSVRANIEGTRFDSSSFALVLAGMCIFVVVWVGRLIVRFGNTPKPGK